MASPLGCTQMEKDTAQQALKERLERLAPTGEPAMVFAASMRGATRPGATCVCSLLDLSSPSSPEHADEPSM